MLGIGTLVVFFSPYDLRKESALPLAVASSLMVDHWVSKVSDSILYLDGLQSGVPWDLWYQCHLNSLKNESMSSVAQGCLMGPKTTHV